MFNIKVSYGSGNSFNVRQPVVADRLPEAEESVLVLLGRLFPDIDFVLVYVDGLTYHVHQVDEPIAHVQITTRDDDV